MDFLITSFAKKIQCHPSSMYNKEAVIKCKKMFFKERGELLLERSSKKILGGGEAASNGVKGFLERELKPPKKLCEALPLYTNFPLEKVEANFLIIKVEAKNLSA